MATLNFTFRINGIPVDVDTAVLENRDATYGVRRVDTLETVVASGTPVTNTGLGSYSYTFTDPDTDLTYDYTLKITYGSNTYYFDRQFSGASVSNLIVIPTSDHFSSQAEVYRIAGEYAVNLMMEDFDSQDSSLIWDQFLQAADDTVSMYVGQHYDPATLYTNKWVRMRATWLVSNLLSQRRGNHQIFNHVERVYEELNMIRDGRFHIPNAKPRAWQGPMWRNYLMQTRDISHPVRVETTKSNKQTYSGMDIAWQPFWYTFNG